MKSAQYYRGLASCTLLLAFVTTKCLAQQHGGVPIRIPDTPQGRCINGSTDRVWLTLYRVVTTKKSGWFTTDNQAEIIINVQVKTQPQSDKPIAFPLSAKANIRSYPTGQISIPVEYTLVSGLGLKQEKKLYTALGVDTTLVNLKGKKGLGTALAALDDIVGSKKLPIPDTPYTQTIGYLMDFANKAVTNDMNDQNGDDKYLTGSLSLNFDPAGDCSGSSPDGLGFETTGTKAILMSDGLQGDGYIPIDRTDQYCWTAETKPVFVLKAAAVTKNVACSDASYSSKYKSVTNNYVAYFLQKRQVSGHLGATNAVRDRKESETLCNVLGVESGCPAAER